MIFRLHGVEFEWDEEKYAVNLRKHGVKFEEAAQVFFDPLSIYDDASVEGEQREYVLGFSYSAKMLFVVFVERGVRTRIISARPATSHERNDYAERN
jgi:uncharacterized DUF497 family protein